MTINIEIENGKESITVSDDYGNRRSLKGMMLLGASREDSEFYMMGLGDHAETARAFGEGLANGCRQAERTGDKWYIAFYRCLLLEMAMRTGLARSGEKVDPEEIRERWEREDREREEGLLSLLSGPGRKIIPS